MQSIEEDYKKMKSEYYRSFEETQKHYDIDGNVVTGAFDQLQVPEDSIFNFVMFLLM